MYNPSRVVCSKCKTHPAAIIKLLIAGSPLPQARDDDRRGDYVSARNKGRIALGLNIAAVLTWIAVITTLVVMFATSIANAQH